MTTMTKKIHPLWTAIFRHGGQDETRELLDFLGDSPLFSTLSRRELRNLADILHHRTYQDGEFVFLKGQPGAAMFIIKTGRINVIDYGKENGETVIATLNSGDLFGELALLDDSPRSASAKAVEPTVIYAISRTDLDHLLTTSPQAGLRVYRALAGIIGTRLKNANVQISDQ